MCLNVNSGSKPQKAKRNMAVYKELFDSKSFYHGFIYEPFKLTPTVNILSNYWNEIEGGYHSRTSKSEKPKTDLFVIPRGSTYFKGRENDPNLSRGINGYVSSNIIYVGKNTLKNRLIGFLRYGVIFHSEKYLDKKLCTTK